MTPSPPSHGPYASAHARARVVTVFLIVGAVISALIVFAEIAQLAFPEFTNGQEGADNPGGMAALLSYSLLTLLRLGVFFITAIVFLMWLHRCSSNLKVFGYLRPVYSPGWAVGSFFVPFANLVMPYQGVKEVWQKSRPANSESFSFSNSPPGFFPAWWAFWLAANVTTNIHFRMMGNQRARDVAIIVGIVSEVLSIAAAAFAVLVIKDIDRRQTETIQHMRPEEFPVPPPPPVFDRPVPEN